MTDAHNIPPQNPEIPLNEDGTIDITPQLIDQVEREQKNRKKAPLRQKVYFGLFVFLSILATFLFWSVKNTGAGSGIQTGTTLTAAIVSLSLAILFGLLTTVHFIRNRSVAGGLFLVTAMSTAVFLGVSQFIGILIPPVALAFTGAEPGVEAGAYNVVIILAQVGLFALWFAFLLFTIKVQVSPIRRVDKVLQKILDGEEIKRIRIGKSRQYKEIELKLYELSKRTVSTDHTH